MEKEWLQLSLDGTAGDRAKVSDLAIKESIEGELEKVRQALLTIRQALLLEGMKVTDDYFHTMKETQFSQEETLLYPRVRYNSERQTVSFHWERLQRRITKAKPNVKVNPQRGSGYSYSAYSRSSRTGQKRRVQVFLTSKHVSINKTSKRISKREFAKEPEWVRIAGEIVEDHLCQLRKENNAVASVSRALANFERLFRERVV